MLGSFGSALLTAEPSKVAMGWVSYWAKELMGWWYLLMV